MCFKKKPIVLKPAAKRALLFGTNYPGTSYKLSGCVNDIDDVAKALPADYEILKFKNNEVTKKCFYDTIKAALLIGRPGDKLVLWYSGHGTQIPSESEPDGYKEGLYMTDGVFTDDDMLELQSFTPEGMIVTTGLDSCFSGGMSKGLCAAKPYKNRFYQMPGVPVMTKRVKSLAKEESVWLINAFCGEGQTSADAFFNNRANGAGTYFYLKNGIKNISFSEAMKRCKTYLPGAGFDQVPDMIGNLMLADNHF